jgi:hypothetical protein
MVLNHVSMVCSECTQHHTARVFPKKTFQLLGRINSEAVIQGLDKIMGNVERSTYIARTEM